MIKSVIILFFSFLLSLKGNAADIKYLLYHVNKEVHLQQKGIKEKAKRGMFLTEKQSIIISELADVMLIQNDGKSMLLNKPGTYTFLQVKKIFNTAKSNGVSAGFFSYVFEKFLNDDSNEGKQKVAGAVYRGKNAMLAPQDSGFLFSKTIRLQWKPEQKNIPYRVSIRVNEISFDTVLRAVNTLTIPARLLKGDNTLLIEWSTLPADSRQKQPAPFIYIIPLKRDFGIIKQQLAHLKTTYSKDKRLMRLMEKDLFESWLELYQLK